LGEHGPQIKNESRIKRVNDSYRKKG
jgi:hypothetical protein